MKVSHSEIDHNPIEIDHNSITIDHLRLTIDHTLKRSFGQFGCILVHQKKYII